MRRRAMVALLLLVAAGALAQAPAQAPAPVDTLVVRFGWIGDGPRPVNLAVAPARTVIGSTVTVVVDLPPGQAAIPVDSLQVDVDWLEPAPDVVAAMPEGLPAPAGARILASYRIYRLGPWRPAWDAGAPGPVLEVAGRLESGENIVSVRDPRALGGLPVWLPAALGGLIVLLIALLVWRRLRGRPAAAEAADLPLPPPAWLQAAVDLWTLEETHGHDRAYLDTLAAVLRRYLHGRYHLPAEEMTAAEVTAAARRAGWSVARLGAFAGILAACDEARYAPAGVGAQQCRLGMQRLLDLIEAERIEPVWTPVAPARTAAATSAWTRLRERYPQTQPRGVPC